MCEHATVCCGREARGIWVCCGVGESLSAGLYESLREGLLRRAVGGGAGTSVVAREAAVAVVVVHGR